MSEMNFVNLLPGFTISQAKEGWFYYVMAKVGID